LQLYGNPQKAVANIAAAVVMLTPNNMFLRIFLAQLKAGQLLFHAP
jgi:hypothetical protein